MELLRTLARAAQPHRRRASTVALLIVLLSSGMLLPLNAGTTASLDTANTPITSTAITAVPGFDAEGDPGAVTVISAPLAGADRVLVDRFLIFEQRDVSQRAANATSQSASYSDSASGIIIRPVPGAVSSGYGYRTHPIHGGRRLHAGWDMTAGCGVPIKSGAAGRVILSGWYGGYGNTIIVDHGGGMTTLYAHQSSLSVSNNEQVSAGQTVGLVGTTGMSTGCHLHYEVRINGNPVDPTPYMSVAQSVLFVGGMPHGGAVRVG